MDEAYKAAEKENLDSEKERETLLQECDYCQGSAYEKDGGVHVTARDKEV